MRKKNLLVLLLLLSMTLISCGGGGGGGEEAPGDDDDLTSPQQGRTTNTALRIIHGAIDTTPVSIRLGDQVEVLQTASYAKPTVYRRVGSGETIISVERAKTPTTIVAKLSATLADKTEYTVFVTGAARSANATAVLLEDQIIRPEPGRAYLRVLNSFNGVGSVSVTTPSGALNSVKYGAGSEYLDIASGPQTYTITSSSGGSLGTLAVNVEDRSEITLLVAGDRELGVSFRPIFVDFD